MCRMLVLCALLTLGVVLPGCGKDDGLTPEQRRHYLTKVLPGIDENVEVDATTGQHRKTVLTSSYELDRCGTAEDRHEDADLLLLGLDLFDRPREVGERAVGDANVVALLENHAGLRLGGAVGDLLSDGIDLRRRNRRRTKGDVRP